MRIGVLSDIHGNIAALDAVLDEAAGAHIDRWLVLGDLVLFGPRPVETLERLADLPDAAFIGGNTDRYVITGEQPEPHRTPRDASGDPALVERFAAMAGAIGWTRGALTQAASLDWLLDLPAEQRVELNATTILLAVHASPHSDEGRGVDTDSDDDDLETLFAGRTGGNDIVIGGHTHVPTDRTVGRTRFLNPGSVGLPRRADGASWMIIDTDRDGTVIIEQRQTAFDVESVVGDLRDRRYPNAPFVSSILRKQHPYAH